MIRRSALLGGLLQRQHDGILGGCHKRDLLSRWLSDGLWVDLTDFEVQAAGRLQFILGRCSQIMRVHDVP